MANAEHLKILKEGVERWNEWIKEMDNKYPEQEETYVFEADISEANLSGVDLSHYNLSNANLTNADLSNSNLSGATLQHVKLIQANMHRANLQQVNLFGANLSNAILTNTDLSFSNLTQTKLSNTNLSGANLNFVDLTYSSLDETKFDKCIIGNTKFGFLDLSTCKGLDSVYAYSECSIDFRTLLVSKNLPKSFLLKIGLPELLIEYLPDFFPDEGIRLYSVFLSHSWANKPFAHKLYEALIARGVKVFFDEKKLKPGDDIFNSLSRGIELYDKTILVCSEDSLNSWWVDQELELVFEKERKLQKEVGEKTGLLIPIRIDDHIDTWPNGKRMAIKQRIIGDFRNWQDDTAFEKALNDLIHALNADRPEVKPVSHLPGKTKP